jgi:hypothetical protein
MRRRTAALVLINERLPGVEADRQSIITDIRKTSALVAVFHSESISLVRRCTSAVASIRRYVATVLVLGLFLALLSGFTPAAAEEPCHRVIDRNEEHEKGDVPELRVSISGVILPEYVSVVLKLLEVLQNKSCLSVYHVVEDKTFIKVFFIDRNGRLSAKHIGSLEYKADIDDSANVIVMISDELFGKQYFNIMEPFRRYMKKRISIEASRDILNILNSKSTDCLIKKLDSNSGSKFYIIAAEYAEGIDNFIHCLVRGFISTQEKITSISSDNILNEMEMELITSALSE